jgi:hypothetical protein
MPIQPYKPDALASGGATERPFQENVARQPSFTQTILRIALRRLPAHGYASTPQTIGVKPPSNAMTMGSHGKTV